MLIRETTFVVTDTETTGTRAGQDRVIEIGAVKIKNGEVIDVFEQLINPHCHVPHFITRLTGISTSMLIDQPSAETVLEDFRDFLGDGVFVAHNLRFDEGMIAGELERAGLPLLNAPSLCTLRLARRVLPFLPSRSLKNLAIHFGLRNRARHRALGDAEVTGDILLRLLQYLEADQGVEEIEELLRFQNKTYGKTRGDSRIVKQIRENIVPRVPDAPGVYFMRDRREQILYIGKALSLQSRVGSYFRAVEGHPEKTRSLVRQIRNVTWTETDTELEALLLESALIKKHLPPFNRALKRYKRYPFIRLDTSHEYPAVSCTPFIQNDGAEYFGPLASRDQATMVVEMIQRLFLLRECGDNRMAQSESCLYEEIDRCLAPCVHSDVKPEYQNEVNRVRSFLMGKDVFILAEIRDRMTAAAQRRQYEDAAWYRDSLRSFSRLLEGRGTLAEPVRRQNGVVLLPGERRVEVHVVQFGMPVRSVILLRDDRGGIPAIPSSETLREMLEFNADTDDEPDRYSPADIDAVRVLTHWMYCHRDNVVPLMKKPGEVSWQFVARVEEALQGV